MSADICLCMNLRSAAQQLTRTYDAALAPSGINASQFSLMNMIRRGDTPTVKDLAQASGLDRSTRGRNLRVLEKQALIAMRVGDDARTRQIALTATGRNTLRRATPLWQAVQDRVSGRLGDENRAQLKGLLSDMLAEEH